MPRTNQPPSEDTSQSPIPAQTVERRILMLRGQKVLLDVDLAELYDVETRVLIQAVQRNRERFPEDFMFQLTKAEFDDLRSQSVISRSSWGGRRYPPYAFTEQGVAMLSSVLHSKRAVQVNIEIMRAFVRLRQMLASHDELARKVEEMEQKYDKQPGLSNVEGFAVVFDAIKQLIAEDEAEKTGPKRQIGFRIEEPLVRYASNSA